MGSIPTTHRSLKEVQASPNSEADSKNAFIITGLQSFNSQLPIAPDTVMVVSFPITWAHTIVRASTCVGFTLPGMIDDPGSLDGISISPIPERGPDANHLMSLAIFIKLTANCFNAP